MVNVTDFRDKAVQAGIQDVEAELLYAPLYEYELTEFALDAYKRFAKANDMPESTHTKNAYLLQFGSVLNRNGTNFSPKMIEEVLTTLLREAKMVTDFAPDYLNRQGKPNAVLDDLYAAAIASPHIFDKPDTKNMSTLIGAEAVKLIHADKYLIPDNGLAFHDSAFSAETKTFHMIRLAAHSSRLIISATRDFEEKGEVSGSDFDEISKLLGHLNNINPLPKRTPLEAKVFENMSALEKIHTEQLAQRLYKITPDRNDAPPFTIS